MSHHVQRFKKIIASRSDGLLDVISGSAADRAERAEKEDSSSTLSSVLDEADSRYKTKLVQLQRFKSKSKAASKSQTHKLEWYKEHKYLDNAFRSNDGDLQSLLEVLILHKTGDSEMYEIMNLDSTLLEERKADEALLCSQLSEMKDMLQMTLKSVKESKLGSSKSKGIKKGSSNSKDGNICKENETPETQNHSEHDSADNNKDIENNRTEQNRSSAMKSIFADMLVQVQLSLASQWSDLVNEEQELYSSILVDRIHISEMLRDDRISTQNDALSRDMSVRDDDDAEVILYMDEWFNRIRNLDKSHCEELCIIDKEKVAETEKYRTCNVGEGQKSVNPADPSSNDDGSMSVNEIPSDSVEWADQDHMTFVKIYRHAQQAGTSRKILMEKLFIQFPNRSAASINLYEIWYRSCRAISAKRKKCSLDYDNARQQLLMQARQQLDIFRKDRKETIEKEKKQVRHEDARKLLHTQLEILRAAKEELNKQLQLESEEKYVQAQRDDEIKKDEFRKIQDWKRTQVDSFQKAREQIKEAQRLQEEERAAKMKEELRLAIESNKGRVEDREKIRIEKEHEKKRNELKKLEMEQARKMDLLLKLAAEVPYWDAIQNAESNLDHITCAVKAQEYLGFQEEARGHKRSTGYADRSIIRDARFRLASALRDAGVASSHYAKQAVQRMNPRPELAIHGII